MVRALPCQGRGRGFEPRPFRMNVIILAAGFSTRLYPLTKKFPKALLKVKNKPILNYVVDDLMTVHGINQAILITNGLYFPSFKQWLKDQRLSFPLKIINNEVLEPDKRQGALGDLAMALKAIPPDDTLVVASDTLISESVQKFVKVCDTKQQAATMLCDLKDKNLIASKLGCASVDDNGTIIKFEEKPIKPTSTLAAIPYYFFPVKTLKYIDEYLRDDNAVDAPGSLLNWLINKIPVYGYIIENGYYYDIGTKEALEKANKI